MWNMFLSKEAIKKGGKTVIPINGEEIAPHWGIKGKGGESGLDFLSYSAPGNPINTSTL